MVHKKLAELFNVDITDDSKKIRMFPDSFVGGAIFQFR